MLLGKNQAFWTFLFWIFLAAPQHLVPADDALPSWQEHPHAHISGRYMGFKDRHHFHVCMSSKHCFRDPSELIWYFLCMSALSITLYTAGERLYTYLDFSFLSPLQDSSLHIPVTLLFLDSHLHLLTSGAYSHGENGIMVYNMIFVGFNEISFKIA